jgi:hypothetical protein
MDDHMKYGFCENLDRAQKIKAKNKTTKVITNGRIGKNWELMKRKESFNKQGKHPRCENALS